MLLYTVALISAISVYSFNLPGIEGWYMELWWYDIFMHILGGFASGLLVLIILRSFRRPVRIWQVIIGALIIGLAWEYFEIYFDLTGHPVGSDPYYFDTALDIIDDCIGGLLAASLFTKFRK
ncbi:MAG: hypothetical protein AAB381_00295 [Patescibacteria group bacterium]